MGVCCARATVDSPAIRVPVHRARRDGLKGMVVLLVALLVVVINHRRQRPPVGGAREKVVAVV
jgi:hypothetical protein